MDIKGQWFTLKNKSISASSNAFKSWRTVVSDTNGFLSSVILISSGGDTDWIGIFNDEHSDLNALWVWCSPARIKCWKIQRTWYENMIIGTCIKILRMSVKWYEWFKIDYVLA